MDIILEHTLFHTLAGDILDSRRSHRGIFIGGSWVFWNPLLKFNLRPGLHIFNREVRCILIEQSTILIED